jgi:hypothetical protein
MVMYYTLYYGICGFCPSSSILKEHTVLENESVSILRRKVEESELGLLLKPNLNHRCSDSDMPNSACASPPFHLRMGRDLVAKKFSPETQ